VNVSAVRVLRESIARKVSHNSFKQGAIYSRLSAVFNEAFFISYTVCAAGLFGTNCTKMCGSHCKEKRCDAKTGSCECDDGFVLINSTCREYASTSAPVSQPAKDTNKFISSDDGFPTPIVSATVSAGSAVVLMFVAIFVCYRRRHKLVISQTKKTRNDTKKEKNSSRPILNPVYDHDDENQVRAEDQVQDVDLAYSDLDSDHRVFAEQHYQMLVNPLFQAMGGEFSDERQYAKLALPPSRQKTDNTNTDACNDKESIYQELD
jgi:hypothetical protein